MDDKIVREWSITGPDIKLLSEFFPGLLTRVGEESQVADDLIELELTFAIALAKTMWLWREQSVERLTSVSNTQYENEVLKVKRILRHLVQGMDDAQGVINTQIAEFQAKKGTLKPKKGQN